MFTPISLNGRVTADLELQTSQNGTQYVQFHVAVNKGFGEHQHPNFYQCILFGKTAERIMHAGVKKGSGLFVTGDLDLCMTGITCLPAKQRTTAHRRMPPPRIIPALRNFHAERMDCHTTEYSVHGHKRNCFRVYDPIAVPLFLFQKKKG